MRLKLLSLILFCSPVWAQTPNIDTTNPAPPTIVRTFFPAHCQASTATLIRSDQTPGQNYYICNSSGSGWVLQASTGSGGSISGVNAQTGTTYTFANTDCSQEVSFNNASSIAATLPQAGGGGNFVAGCAIQVVNKGAGTLTITSVVSTIGGSSTLSLTTGQSSLIVSDDVNYDVLPGRGTGTGGGGLPTILISTSGPINVSSVGFYFNNSTGGMLYNVPTITTPTIGNQYCFRNYTTITSQIQIKLPAGTQADYNGATTSAGGTFTSPSALGDSACLVASTTSLYIAYVYSGVWTLAAGTPNWVQNLTGTASTIDSFTGIVSTLGNGN